MSEIENKIISIAAEQAGVEPAGVTPEHRFIEDLNFDSLDLMEFSMSVEDAFDVSLPDDQVGEIKSIRQAIDLVTAHTESARVSAP